MAMLRAQSCRCRLLALFRFVIVVGVRAVYERSTATAELGASPEQELQQGLRAYRQGAFPQAIVHWTEAARGFESEGKTTDQAQALIYLAQALQQSGRYRDAGGALSAAMKLAQARVDQTQVATIDGRLGNIYFAIGQNQMAIQTLNDGLAIARKLDDAALVASLLNDLGNVLAVEGRLSEAEAAYTDSARLAKATRNDLLAVTATINGAKAAMQQGLYPDA